MFPITDSKPGKLEKGRHCNPFPSQEGKGECRRSKQLALFLIAGLLEN